ncbi:MAG: EscU/YscU/HrcU family type III secretion system export apparatus switch protein [Deltaproteobacteria bacterium]|nr:EscU/YscU/HrcU family type III secretion system export apparatus switch protein [Deltaproteobacteria bacterium]
MDKRYAPTARKLRKLRADGNLPKSRYLTQCVVLTGILAATAILMTFAWVRPELLLEYLLTAGLNEPATASWRCFLEALKVVVVVLGFGALVGSISEAAQAGIGFDCGLIAPRLSRVDIISGCRRLLSSSKQAPVLFLRLVSVLAIFSAVMLHQLSGWSGAAGLAAHQRTSWILQQALLPIAAGFIITALLAALDLYLVRRRWWRSAGMTLEEVRREHKEEEGDPLMRSLRRSRHEELALQDLVKKIRGSRVIVVEGQ